MNFEPYLHFNGNCEEALAFYAGVFDGKMTEVMRYGDVPSDASMPPMPAEQKNKIMHSSFIAPSVRFMASDGPPGSELPDGDRISLSLATNDVGEGHRMFEALSVGGTVTMPFADTFWGARFGMLKDKFGVEWMVNAQKS